MNIFLIGYRCTGKTTVGRILARLLSLRFVDTDDGIVRAIGQSICTVVAEKGWDHFRRWERKIMVRVCADDGQVVGTGGGVILNPENTVIMKRSGTVIWLKASPETIVRRIKTDDDTPGFRPSLTGKAASAEAVEILSQRAPLYRQASDFEVMTDDRSTEMVACEIIRVLAFMVNDSTCKRKGKDR